MNLLYVYCLLAISSPRWFARTFIFLFFLFSSHSHCKNWHIGRGLRMVVDKMTPVHVVGPDGAVHRGGEEGVGGVELDIDNGPRVLRERDEAVAVRPLPALHLAVLPTYEPTQIWEPPCLMRS